MDFRTFFYAKDLVYILLTNHGAVMPVVAQKSYHNANI